MLRVFETTLKLQAMKTAQNKTNRKVQSINTKNIRDIAKILKELFPTKLFKNIKTNAGGFWKLQLLAMTAVLWMIVGEPTILIAFESAFDILLAAIPGLGNKKATYQGFTGQLARYQSQLMQVIIPHLRKLTKSKLEKYWRIGKWIVIAADGSRESLARNKDLLFPNFPMGAIPYRGMTNALRCVRMSFSL